MKYRPLGRTGLFVSELALGTMTFGTIDDPRYAAAGGIGQSDVDGVVRRALDAGINLIDTANVYAEGDSEEMLGRALTSLGVSRHDVVIATKAAHAVGPGPNDAGASRVHVVNQVEASLRRLGTDYVDLYQLHGFDPATPIEETVRALDDLVRRGLVRYVGVSNWAAWQVARALGHADRLGASPFQSVQAYYSLVGRGVEREIVPFLEAEGLGLLVYSPLAGGYLTGKYRDGGDGRRTVVPFPPVDEGRSAPVLDVMDRVAAAHGTSLAAVALTWILRQPTVTSVIVGVKRLDQLEANLEAVGLGLSDDDLAALDAASALADEYPGWARSSEAGRRTLLETGELQPLH